MRIRYDYILPEVECAEVQLQIENPTPPNTSKAEEIVIVIEMRYG